MKKVAVFMLVCLFLVGIAVVDDSHSLMTGKEAELSLQTRRIDSRSIKGCKESPKGYRIANRRDSWVYPEMSGFYRMAQKRLHF